MTGESDGQTPAARPMVAPDTSRELLAAKQRIDARTAQMAELDRQPSATGDTGRQPGGYYDLQEQNKLDDWRMTRGYLDADGVVRLPNPAGYLDEMTGDAPGTWAAKNMTATQTNAAMRPFLAESMELSGAKQMQARVDAGQMSPADAEAEQALTAGIMGVAMSGGRRGSKANSSRPASPTQQCPPTSPATAGRSNMWTKKDVAGRRVYQRDDLIDSQKTDDLGRTNRQRMQGGLPPIGADGKPINLHHTVQSEPGSIVELTETFHKDNSGVLHMYLNGQAKIGYSSAPPPIDRSTFRSWSRDYWMERAKDFP